MSAFQKQYVYRIPWFYGLAWLLAYGLVLMVICAMASDPKANVVIKSGIIQYAATRLYLVGWCYYLVGVIAGIILKLYITITDNDITIPLIFPFWKKVTIPFAAMQDIRAVKGKAGYRSPGTPSLLIIKFRDKEYKISQWRIGMMSDRSFFECILCILENVQAKRPDLINACHSVHIVLPKLDQSLPPAYKPSKLFIAILIILLTPVFLLVGFIIFEIIKHWLIRIP